MQNDTTRLIPTLDGWRAIAILGVIACHSTTFLFPNPVDKHGFIYHLLYYGCYGVDIFFGISGFLICSRLLDSELLSGRVSFRDFYIRRFFRILPPYVLYLAFLLVLQLAGWVDVGYKTLLSCLLFVPNYTLNNGLIHDYIGHFWTLAVEEHYYLLFPSVLVLLGNNFKRRLGSLLGWGLLIALWRAIEFRMHFLGHLLPDIGFYTRSDVRLDGLIFGAAAAIFWRAELFHPKLKKVLASEWSCIFLIALLIASITQSPPFSMLWQALLIPALLLSTTLNPAARLSRLLATTPLQWIGRLSYSLYIWNNFFLVSTRTDTGNTLPPIPILSFFQTAPWNYGALLCVAVLSHYGIERPLIRIGKRLTDTGR